MKKDVLCVKHLTENTKAAVNHVDFERKILEKYQ